MKKLKLIPILGLITVSLLFFNCENNDQIELFENNSEENIVSEFYDDNISQKIFLTSTPKSELFSISILKNGKITPIAFYSEKGNNFKMYNLDGKLEMNGTIDKTISEVNEENEKYFSSEKLIKIDFKTARNSSCMGGSTWNCIRIAWNACDSDTICRLACISTGWNCPAAIAAACAIHCNT